MFSKDGYVSVFISAALDDQCTKFNVSPTSPSRNVPVRKLIQQICNPRPMKLKRTLPSLDWNRVHWQHQPPYKHFSRKSQDDDKYSSKLLIIFPSSDNSRVSLPVVEHKDIGKDVFGAFLLTNSKWRVSLFWLNPVAKFKLEILISFEKQLINAELPCRIIVNNYFSSNCSSK